MATTRHTAHAIPAAHHRSQDATAARTTTAARTPPQPGRHRSQDATAAKTRYTAAQTSQLCMQDLPRILQFTPPRRPYAAPWVYRRMAAVCWRRTPPATARRRRSCSARPPGLLVHERATRPRRAAPAPLCRCVAAVFRTHGALTPRGARRHPWARRRRSSSAGPPGLLVPGATVAARPPAPAARGRAGRRAVRPFLLAPTGYGCLPRLVPRTGLVSLASPMQAGILQQLFKAAHPPASAARPTSPPSVLHPRTGAPRFSAPLAFVCGFVSRLVCGGFHACRLVLRPGAAGYGGMAPARMGRGATGFAVPVAFAVPVVCAVPAGSAVPVAPTIPARMAIAAPVVGAAPIGASPPALRSGAPSGGASGGAGSPPRCGAPPPVGCCRFFPSSGAFCLLVPVALQAKKGRALCGNASSVPPLDRAAFPPAG